MPSLHEIARQLVAPTKGILAADESSRTACQRFAAEGIECTEETRRQYRQLFFTAPGVEQYLSGIILFDETASQTNDSGVPFPQFLASKGIIAGIKVDTGVEPLSGFPEEVVTTGLDGLQERLATYTARGLKFAKWRAVIRIGKAVPSQACIESNAHALARYAADCQTAGLVPVVEPEVLLEGEHSIERCAEVMASTFDALFTQIDLLHVDHQALILKTSMALSGSQASEQASVEQVAKTTIDVLTSHVPHDLAGIVFLSGGQSSEQATEHLAAISSLGEQPWPLTFSFARALQEAAMHAWAGKLENVSLAQQLFLEAARRNSQALPH